MLRALSAKVTTDNKAHVSSIGGCEWLADLKLLKVAWSFRLPGDADSGGIPPIKVNSQAAGRPRIMARSETNMFIHLHAKKA